ncbi:UDP-glucose:protein N-beta-glucosyltransferase [Moraxella pluranimalium]|uniref:Adhesin n=1 Tax=Moraxella pluranimalium TaxID=470453 RepID=A0A1T0CUI1_9GAMM|nr:adhesin [Moraxella pluranimalium]OOS26008.1 adhesin [Moraxella pluranimalium]
MSQNKQASVIRFEQAVAKKDFEVSCNELLDILGSLDNQFGGIHQIECNYPQQLNFSEQERVVHFATRVASAVTELFDAKNNFSITEGGFNRFMTLHRWLGLIFASSPYVNADHILKTYDANPNPNPERPLEIHLPNNIEAIKRFCILYTMESNVPLNLDVLWNLNPSLCASLCFALQSPRFIGTESSFTKRAAVLKWFPEKLKTFENLNTLPSAISHDVYMHCSYDVDADKHRVKESLNAVIRKHLLASGWADRDVKKIGRTNGKPVMFVVLEHFHSAHSIYRTHSTSMIAARELFHIVGFGGEAVDQAGRDVFDEFHLLNQNSIFDKLNAVKDYAEKLEPAVLYMPSIGMDLTTIFLSNTQIAPIQSVALGHPGTTHSPFIDYVIVEDDYVGSEDCFSETLLRLPKDALPYVPSALAPNSVEYRLRENPEVVNIGIASTTMKLNPYFLKALQTIRDRAKVKVHFHFALGQSSGITHPYVERFIKSYLGDSATAHPHTPYHQYLGILHQCDMMVNPFPFGNTNGIIDMVTLGLVGVCKTGPEVHEHIDEGLFGRLGLPEWLIANTADEYVERAIRLAENHEERLALRRHIIENNGLSTLFTGNPKPMGEVLLAKVAEKGLLDDTPATKAAKKPAAKKSADAKTSDKADDKAVKKAPAKKATKSTATKTAADKPKKTTTRRKKTDA